LGNIANSRNIQNHFKPGAENYAWGGPHIHLPFSTKVVMFRRIFHFHSRPQTKHKPLRTKLGRGNYIGNYPLVGVVEGYRGSGSPC